MTKLQITLTGILFAGTLGCSNTGPDHRVSGPLPNIVLMSIDTLRADYFSAEHMPLSYDWAERKGVICTRAHANSTWTMPSHVTLLTGLLPREHGVEYRDSRVPPELPTIPVFLREVGYRSHAFTNSGYVSKHLGMAEHFDAWDQIDNLPDPQYFQTLLEPFEQSRELLAQDHDGPIFVLLHTYYVHEYFIEASDLNDRDFADLDEWNAYRTEKAHGLGEPEHTAWVREAYAAKARLFDAYLFDFLRWLETTPAADNLCVIMTSDHGEGLFEDHIGEEVYGHCGAPYPERVRIPLSFSGLTPARRTDLVSLKDLPGIIVHLARNGELRLPERTSIETEFLSADRDKPNKVRHTSRVSADGSWTLAQAPGSSIDDTRKVVPLEKAHLEQLQVLGYVQ